MQLQKKPILLLLLVLFQLQCKSQNTAATYTSETLKIIPISENSYLHISYLNTNNFGKVACNGMLYIKNKEAIVFDTPTNSEVSKELLNWVTKTKNAKVKAVVINHFHVDCLGCLLYTSPSPRDRQKSRMPSSA